ncbi:hypothetical protein GCM10022631_07530 [Deinococcus rubellus]
MPLTPEPKSTVTTPETRRLTFRNGIQLVRFTYGLDTVLRTSEIPGQKQSGRRASCCGLTFFISGFTLKQAQRPPPCHGVGSVLGLEFREKATDMAFDSIRLQRTFSPAAFINRVIHARLTLSPSSARTA